MMTSRSRDDNLFLMKRLVRLFLIDFIAELIDERMRVDFFVNMSFLREVCDNVDADDFMSDFMRDRRLDKEIVFFMTSS